MFKHIAKRIRQLHYSTVLIAQVLLLFLIAIMSNHIVLIALFVLGLFGVFGSIIGTIWGRTLPRSLALICGAVAILGGIPAAIPDLPLWGVTTALLISSLAYAAFILIALVAISKSIFVTERVTINTIVGSVCIYVLVGMFFAFFYAAMGIALPDSFHLGLTEGPRLSRLADFVYFSFTTLTTTGYGDVFPTHPVTRMLSVIEGITGSLYIAVMVARLVGMHVVTQGRGK